MNFIHIADLHLDGKAKTSGGDSEKRRQEILNAFVKMIDYIKNKNINYLFIAGDLYEHKYIRDTTIEILIEQFKRIPNTNIFITPGNHDPYVVNSVYDRFDFPENVHIFKEMEIFETKDANIFGVGFIDFFPRKSANYSSIKPIKNGKKNILIAHTDISSLDNEYDKEIYKLTKKGFDYVAMGHIHMGNYDKNSNILYSGSFAKYNFKSAKYDKAGAIYGEFTQYGLKTELIQFDNTKYIEYVLDITNIRSVASLILDLNHLNFKSNEIVRIILEGEKNFDVNKKYIMENINNSNIVQIVDNTSLKLEYKKIKEEVSLIGIYLKNADNLIEGLKEKRKYAKDEIEKEEIDKKIKQVEEAIVLVLEEINNI